MRKLSTSAQRAATGDVVDDDGDRGADQVGGDETLELLLPRGVPHHDLDDLVALVDVLHHEVHADRGLSQAGLRRAWGRSSRT